MLPIEHTMPQPQWPVTAAITRGGPGDKRTCACVNVCVSERVRERRNIWTLPPNIKPASRAERSIELTHRHTHCTNSWMLLTNKLTNKLQLLIKPNKKNPSSSTKLARRKICKDLI